MLSIQRDGYNQLSEELKKQWPGLRQGEIMQFEHVNVRKDRDNPGRIIGPIHQDVPVKSSVWDPGHERWIPIAAIKGSKTVDKPTGDGRTTPVEVTEFYDIAIKHASGCRLILQGSNPDHVRMAEYLFFAGYNESRDNRPSGEKPLYRYRDDKAKAAKQMARVKIRRAADAALEELLEDPNRVRGFAAAMGWGSENALAALTNKLITYAEEHPDKFLKTTGDPSLRVKGTVAKAFDQGILSFDDLTFEVKWAATGEKVLAYPKLKGKKAKLEQTTMHILDSDDGSYLLGELQRQLGERIDEKSKNAKPVVEASKAAEILAAENGVDLSGVVGTGANGRITKGDVEDHLATEG
jgi:hypothetical protein